MGLIRVLLIALGQQWGLWHRTLSYIRIWMNRQEAGSISHRLRPLLDSMGTTLINDTRAFTHWSCINVAGQSGLAYLNARAYKAATPPDCHPFLFSEQDNTWQRKVKRLKVEERSYHTFMESPLLETRACPSCPGLIVGADPHHLCFECLGDQDMTEVEPFTFAIHVRHSRLPFTFAIPAANLRPHVKLDDDFCFASVVDGGGWNRAAPH